MLRRRLKQLLVRVPGGSRLARLWSRWVARRDASAFVGSKEYWEKRYARGGTSGAGSYDRLARFKAEFLNTLVRERQIKTVIEFGCGDGAQLSLAEYPQYLGFDVAATAVEHCRRRFLGDDSKRFERISAFDPAQHRAELVLSLDVIFHLVEDEVFERYMSQVFSAAERWVVVYSSDKDQATSVPHVRHRQFSRWIAQNRPDWRLAASVQNPYPYNPADPEGTSFADFYVFERAH